MRHYVALRAVLAHPQGRPEFYKHRPGIYNAATAYSARLAMAEALRPPSQRPPAPARRRMNRSCHSR
jgi:hypothetical protein